LQLIEALLSRASKRRGSSESLWACAQLQWFKYVQRGDPGI
jgi:hypothetical protein